MNKFWRRNIPNRWKDLCVYGAWRLRMSSSYFNKFGIRNILSSNREIVILPDINEISLEELEEHHRVIVYNLIRLTTIIDFWVDCLVCLSIFQLCCQVLHWLLNSGCTKGWCHWQSHWPLVRQLLGEIGNNQIMEKEVSEKPFLF